MSHSQFCSNSKEDRNSRTGTSWSRTISWWDQCEWLLHRLLYLCSHSAASRYLRSIQCMIIISITVIVELTHTYSIGHQKPTHQALSCGTASHLNVNKQSTVLVKWQCLQLGSVSIVWSLWWSRRKTQTSGGTHSSFHNTIQHLELLQTRVSDLWSMVQLSTLFMQQGQLHDVD
jgi:hypothetical protein